VQSEEQLVQHLNKVNSVVGEYLKGSDPTKISKELSIPRQQVVQYIQEWKVSASDNAAIRARAKEALAAADEHFGRLIAKSYEVIDDADTNGDLRSKAGAIKLVMDIESKRIEMLQKAGLLENKELAEEMIEIERKQEVIKQLLMEIGSEHPEIRDKIMKRLSEIAKAGETIVVSQSV
jgi:hypothetical protein